MKIYASDLTNVTEVLTGDLLSIVNPNTSGTGASQGLRITGATANRWLQSSGQEAIITNTISGRIPVAVDQAAPAIDGVADANQFINSSVAQTSTGDVMIQKADASAANLTITGNLIVQGATTNVESTNLNVEDQYISVNRAFNASGAAVNPTSNEAGILMTQTNGSFAGFRYNGSNFQTNTDTNADGTSGTWTNLATGSGTVNAHAENFVTSTSAATTHTVLATTHGLAGSDFTVSVYDIDTTDIKTLVIPETVTVGSNASGSGAGLEGTVTITLPNLGSPAKNFRVVIKG